MKYTILSALSLATIFLISSCQNKQEEGMDYTQFVNPMIGTGAHYSEKAAGLWGTERKQKPLPTSKLGTMAGYDQAHDPGQCIPAVLEPNGMNFWVAQTEDTEQKEISPYYYKDEEIQGFRNSHFIVGGMTQDFGSMTLMPLFGKLVTNPLERASKFSHDKEIATPSYYSVELQDYGINAEMTATSRTALFRFTYSQAGDAYLVVNPNSDENLGRVSYDASTGEISGSNPVHRIYQGWGEYANFDGHFVVQINKQADSFGVYSADSIYEGQTEIKELPGVGAFVKFHVEAGETVLVKAASSFTSIDGARKNLAVESPDWDFDKMHNTLAATWKNKLGTIEVESQDHDALVNFYTALYHAMFLPNALNDVDGAYPAYSVGQPIQHTDGTYYDDYSMWDTYRALHPLLCILDPEKEGDIVQSLIDKYHQGGWLPIFPCWNSYTSEMIGDHCASLVADAYFKGIRNFDIEEAYNALHKNAFEQPESYEDYAQGKGRRALTSYMKYGYIPVQDSVKEAFHTGEQTSRTLEYAYDDFVLSRLAEALGKTDDAKVLLERSKNYRNVYNPELGWVDGRNEDGTFVDGDPFKFQKYITEGQPCHYTWYVPQDIPGLIEIMGGADNFVAKLDTLFDGKYYWHGNEPCHQIAYLYDYAGHPEKTQQRVHEILKSEYSASADGLAGNDDAGQMSAWYVFSALGFYPVCPGVPEYALGSPSFTKATIRMAGGKDFTIIAKGASEKNIYIKSAKLNGKPFDASILQHADIAAGGTLELEMGE